MTFLDTSGLAAKYDSGGPLHSAAMAAFERLVRSGVRLLTTSLVMVEIGDYFSKAVNQPTALQIRKLLLASDRVQVVQVTPAHESAAWRMFERFAEKVWGMTDCVSFVVMKEHVVTKEHGCRDAFTADRHFRQAGFAPLLEPRDA